MHLPKGAKIIKTRPDQKKGTARQDRDKAKTKTMINERQTTRKKNHKV
jgi:hypothetical protein